MTNTLFILGGKDLEMNTIADALKAAGENFIYSGDRWGVRAAKYAQEIADAAKEGKTIYLVELDNAPGTDWNRNALPVIELPEGCKIIDHHGDYTGNKQSILQVLDVIGVEPNRWQKLVAIKDEGYIPQLRAAGATEAEIEELMLADRQAQDITADQEEEAIRAIANRETVGGLEIVRMSHSKCAPVTDRLFGLQSQQNVLIVSEYTDDEGNAKGELNYYGYNARVEELKANHGGWTGGLESDNNAFWGNGVTNENGVHDVVIAYLKSFEA